MAFSGPVNPASGVAPEASTGRPERDTGASHAGSQPPRGRRGRRIRGGLGEPGPEGGEDAPEDREGGNAEVTLSMASRRAAVRALSPLSDGLSGGRLRWEVPVPGGCEKTLEVDSREGGDFLRW